LIQVNSNITSDTTNRLS